MYKKIEGIVVGEYPFEDNSKIINVFTKEGIIDIIAKGAKKIKSPFFATTSKFSYGLFNIVYKEKGLSKLTDADIIKDYRSIKKDFNKISYATLVAELATKVYKHDNNNDVFTLFIECMDKINDGFDPRIIANILKLKLLDYLGIKPVIDSCIECGSKNNIVTISSYLGGFVCKECLKNEKIVSPKTISLIRMLYYVDIKKISKLDISKEIVNEIEVFTDDYYDRYSGIYLKSSFLIKK